MNYLERRTSAFVLCMLKTNAVGRRSNQNGVRTQYSRHDSAKQTTRAYRGRGQRKANYMSVSWT